MLGLLIGACLVTSCWFDVSSVYHEVKAQSVLKLYVIINTLEIFDKLFSALSQVRQRRHERRQPPTAPGFPLRLASRQSVLFTLLSFCHLPMACPAQDTIFNLEHHISTWTSLQTTRQLLVASGAAFLCLSLHVVVLLFQVRCGLGACPRLIVEQLASLASSHLAFTARTTKVIALMVAINTRSTSLMTILISNQFMEIKVGRMSTQASLTGVAKRSVSECHHLLPSHPLVKCL
jgi:hypothetical protein